MEARAEAPRRAVGHRRLPGKVAHTEVRRVDQASGDGSEVEVGLAELGGSCPPMGRGARRGWAGLTGKGGGG